MRFSTRSLGIFVTASALVAATGCSDSESDDDNDESEEGNSDDESDDDSDDESEEGDSDDDSDDESEDDDGDDESEDDDSDDESEDDDSEPDGGTDPDPTETDGGDSVMEDDAGATIIVDEPSLSRCIHFSEPEAIEETESSDGGSVDGGALDGGMIDGGMIDAGPPAPDVAIQSNAFVGDYLVDRFGKPLYIYTADLPGDCESPPETVCFDNCARVWPPYFAGERNLGEGVDDSAFGSFMRPDGTKQSTYLGWPIYTFLTDNKPETSEGFISGHGKGGVWMAARTNSYNIVVMRKELPEDVLKYLATELGQTIYSFDQDTPGTAESDPSSACTGTCREVYPPVRLAAVSPFGGLLAEDFTVFVREEDGGIQLAYKGMPLYWSTKDATRGEINGEGDGWSVVTP